VKLPFPEEYEPEEFANGDESGLFPAVCRKYLHFKGNKCADSEL
jgi:hypothetical protein